MNFSPAQPELKVTDIPDQHLLSWRAANRTRILFSAGYISCKSFEDAYL
jgi:hypothetical protein